MSKNPAAATDVIAASTSAPAGVEIRPHLASNATIGGNTPIEVGGKGGASFEREAAPIPPYNGGNETTPCFDKWAATMPSFGWDATTTASCFKVKGLAATAPSF